MADVAEHPVVAAARHFAATPDPDLERQLLLAIAEIKQAAVTLGEVTVSHVVDDANRPGIMNAAGRLMHTQIALWEALVHLPSARSRYGAVRAALADAMDELAEVVEVAAFKLDPEMSATLQQRIASVTDEAAGDDDWRAVLAAL